jgi:hypothetical protein
MADTIHFTRGVPAIESFPLMISLKPQNKLLKSMEQ